jgi:formylglycine-generating enzyme required for sulfatase activity/tRNA A-37 threonylcarbamoyl transferase component Bud32
MPDHEDSLGGETLDGDAKADRAEQSLGDGSTLGGGDTSSLSDTNDGEGDHLAAGLPVIDLGARFEIEGELGQGGMGAVLLARDKSLGRQVAIKRILGTMIRSSATISRFIIEAKSIAALNHNNIVQIHEFGQDADGPLIVIEYVSGGSLLERLRKGKLDPEEAIRITCQLCDALTLAHGKGIIHRDIKPANVLLTEDGVPKLTDFGLAKQQNIDHGQTAVGTVMGTIDFMPLEQRSDSSSVDERSDLWSLAAVSYQMLTGNSPKVIRLDKLPTNIASVLGRMLEEDPADRFASAAEFKEALESTASNVIAASEKELTSGVCPACDAVNGENRKFCGECAESLRTVCLGCDIEMAVWDKICGECGGRQTELRQQAIEKAAFAENYAREALTDVLGMTLAFIRAGTFMMGTPVDGTDKHDDAVQHEVTITKEFCIQTTEVTQGQWRALMGTEPWQGLFFHKGYGKKGADYPATYVSWDDAVAYCRKLSAKEGKTYRLPTAAEWEYACRGGSTTAWSFGDDKKELGDYAWCRENANDIGEQYAHQVGLKKPNGFGLYDMHGNVWEWCSDYYEKSYYKQSPEKDPTGPTQGSTRELRGGSWASLPRESRSAARLNVDNNYRNHDIGFRVVRELD